MLCRTRSFPSANGNEPANPVEKEEDAMKLLSGRVLGCGMEDIEDDIGLVRDGAWVPEMTRMGSCVDDGERQKYR